MLDVNRSTATSSNSYAVGSSSGNNFGESATTENYNLSDSLVKPLNDWVYQTAAMANLLGYRPIPYFSTIGRPSTYGNNNRYPQDDPKWVNADIVAIALDNVVLVDWDGYKGQVISISELADKLGITEVELRGAEVQNDPKKNSKHFFFRLPDGFDTSTIMDSNNGHFIKGVDFKTGNQLAYLKQHKELRNGVLPPAASLPIAPTVITDVILKPKVAATQIGELKTCTKENQHALLHLDDACNALATMGPDTGRNNKLNELCLEFLSMAHGGFLHVATVHDRLLAAYTQCGGEGFEATFNSANRKAATQPRNTVKPHVGAVAFGDGAIPQQHNSPTLPNVDSVQGNPCMDISQQIELFKGCVYVASINSILTPIGAKLDQSTFRAEFGGHGFIVGEKANGQLKITDNAWRAFTENVLHHFPKVNELRFDPNNEFGHVDEKFNIRSVNTYRPMMGERVSGDTSIFFDYLSRLLPVKEDREILLNWMAYKVQNPGACMRWVPVLIGIEGNGKTSLSDIMEYCIGENYTATVQSNDVDSKFNPWVKEKLFAKLNDFKAGETRTVMEILKPVITDKRVAVQAKGVNTETANNHLGIMITSNHRDAIIKTNTDRRYAVFFTDQMEFGDLERCGMDEAFFIKFHNWLEVDGGLSFMADYLSNRNVANHPIRAPRTSSQDEAIEASRSPLQQFIVEHIENNAPGTMDGVIVTKSIEVSYQSPVSGRAIGQALREIGYKTTGKRIAVGKDNYTVFHPANQFDLLSQLPPSELIRRSGWVNQNGYCNSDVFKGR